MQTIKRPEASVSLPQRDPRGRKPTCLCGTCPKCVHRTHKREYMRDYNAGIRSRAPRVWTKENDALLGAYTDKHVAAALCVTAKAVSARRYKLGISRHNKQARKIQRDGYTLVCLNRDDPMLEMTRHGRYVFEHRLVMARSLGRPLTRDEFVHHRNGIRSDNRLENLELWSRSHPDGQRVQDKLEWAIDFIERYARDGFFTGESLA